MRAILTAHRAGRRDGGEDGRHPFHALGKPHVEIPLVEGRERLYAARYFVLGKFLELGLPFRIDRPVGFEVAANPFDEIVSRRAFGHFHSVMNAADAHPFFGERFQLIEMFHGDMPFAAVAVHHHGVTPSNMLLSVGQPFLETTASTGNPLSFKHFANNMQPALCSCWAKPWLGVPAMSRIFFLAGEFCWRAGLGTEQQ